MSEPMSPIVADDPTRGASTPEARVARDREVPIERLRVLRARPRLARSRGPKQTHAPMLIRTGAHRMAMLAVLAGGSLFGGVSDARAGQPPFGPFDVPTIFFVSKSDDHNRVDYGIHLDEHCVPTRDDAVYFYWREFERAPPVVVHTPGMFDFIGYGISEQRTLLRAPNVGVHFVKLRQFSRPVQIITTQGADGRCKAQARSVINGKDSELSFVYLKLAKGGFTPSVSYVDLHGKDLETGREVVERVRK